MAADLLSTIADEIDARLAELRPACEEHEQLLIAAAALDGERAVSAPRRRGRPRATSSRATRASRPRTRAKPSTSSADRSARGAARGAILAALEHGSHTVAELATVTAMKTPNLNGNLRRLLNEGAVAKTEREGKTAYRLAS